ncbi:MAG TPA: TonB-dependent receptor [Vicinamibacterales bacterium]
MFQISRSALRPEGVLLLFLILLGLVAPAAQASGYGAPADPPASSVRGTVSDPDGARVPRARVLLSSALSIVAMTEADTEGGFQFDRVAPGRYELRVMAEGFRTEPLDVVVTAGEEVRVSVGLHVSAIAESVVVSAAQVEVPLARAADSVTVLSSSDLRAAQVETIADALRSVPGLTVSRNGGRGGVTSLFPRGGESDFTLVMVDGIKANAFGGGYDFSTLSASDVERVEVVRGPESALFGADAIGAVVQVVTRRGGAPRIEGSVERGSFGTSRVGAGTWGSHGRWSWGASGERTSSTGFTGVAPATGERVSNDDFLANHASFSGGWHAEGGADIRGTVSLTSNDRGFPGPFGSNPIGVYTAVDTFSRGQTTTRQYGVRWTQPLARGTRQVRQTASASYLDQKNDFTTTDFSTGQPMLSASGTTRLDARAQTDVALSSVAALSVGVEVQREQATASYITADARSPVPINRHVIAAFGEVRYQPRSRFTLTGGVRAERIVRDQLGRSLDPFSPRPVLGTDVQTSVNPRVSVAYVLTGPGTGSTIGWTRLHAAAGTGMRPPDAIEIAFTDNPGLKPERSRSIEAGVDQATLHERLVLGATAFFNRYDDLIVAVGPALHDASRYRTDNISNASSKGVELSSALRTGWGLSARLSYTFLDTEILAVDRLGEAPAPFHVGDPLLRRPRHSASLDLTFTRRSLTAFGRVGSRARTLDVEPSYGTFGGLFFNPGFTVIDVGGSWRLASAVEVIGRIGNLFDRRYEESFGFPALGRNVTIGVRLAAGR